MGSSWAKEIQFQNSRSPIYQADKFLEERLGDNCQETATQELENITLSLKAIGNAGRPSTSVPTILKCAAKTNSSSYVNIDAIQSLRRFPCSHKITNGLMYIFDDLAMDTEIRIESYLALMRCPNEKLIKKIADILNEEKNNQVASFVSSHLTNALESSEPVYGVPWVHITNLCWQHLRNIYSFTKIHGNYFFSDYVT